MLRAIVIVGLVLPSAAYAALDTRGGTNSPESATGGGFFGLGRRVTTTQNANEPRQVAQFGAPRQSGNVQFPQQGQAAPAPAQPSGQFAPAGQPATSPSAAETPRSRTGNQTSTSAKKGRKTPKPEVDAAEPATEVPAKKPAEDAGDLDKMVKKLEKDKVKASEVENELAKSADEATTIVAGFLRSSNDGVYSKAATYLTPELQKYFESEMSAVNGSLKTVLDQVTRNGDIRSVTYANATVRGEGAVVDAELTYGTGSPEKKMFDLLKTKTGWKIVLPVNAGAAQKAAAPAPARAAAPSNAMMDRDVAVSAATPAPTPVITPAPPQPTVAVTAPIVPVIHTSGTVTSK